jgi:transcription factor YY
MREMISGTVSGVGNNLLSEMEANQILTFQSFGDPGDEVFQEEIVGDDGSADILCDVPIPEETQNNFLFAGHGHPNIIPYGEHEPRKTQKRARRKSTKTKADDTRKWAQKQVQIKTLEGEFSVTMWSSGPDGDVDLDEDTKAGILPQTVDDEAEHEHDQDLEREQACGFAAENSDSEYSNDFKIPVEMPGVDIDDPKQLAAFASNV